MSEQKFLKKPLIKKQQFVNNFHLLLIMQFSSPFALRTRLRFPFFWLRAKMGRSDPHTGWLQIGIGLSEPMKQRNFLIERPPLT